MRRTKRLGRYHLLERIAYGGMAEIFRGFTYDEDGYRRDVAIKKLLPRYVEDKNFIMMLTDEFKLVSQLRHPNIAEVYELAEVGGDLFIAMEFVDGKDLRSTVHRARELGVSVPLDDMVYAMARALDGLHHAHMARDGSGEPLRIVHRDFSPSNILVGYDGTVKICDFGIAKATQSRIQTKAGVIKGKVKYMSPEQAFGRRLDWRSDIFSAGSVLYELCTGRAPFSAKNEMDLIFAVRDAEPDAPDKVNPAIPLELARVLSRSMSRSRSGRYQTCKEFRDALLDYLRRASPDYRRSQLSRLLKRLWAGEIESELREFEDFVLDESSPANFGRNLLADVLGPDAAFSRFTPNPSHSARDEPDAGPTPAAPTPVVTRVLDTKPRPTEEFDESEDDLLPGEPTRRSEAPVDPSGTGASPK